MPHRVNSSARATASTPETGTLSLHYAFDTGPRFEERIVFPAAARRCPRRTTQALDRVFRLLLLACGVSYYKAFAPDRVALRGISAGSRRPRRSSPTSMSRASASSPGATASTSRRGCTSRPMRSNRRRRCGSSCRGCTCVPVGGGKDSIVTIECLKQAGEPLVLFSLGNAAPIEATIAQAGLPCDPRDAAAGSGAVRAERGGRAEWTRADHRHSQPDRAGLRDHPRLRRDRHVERAFGQRAQHRRREPPVQQVVRIRAGVAAGLLERHVVDGRAVFLAAAAADRGRHRAPLRASCRRTFRYSAAATRRSASRRSAGRATGAAIVRNAASSSWRWRRSWIGSA